MPETLIKPVPWYRSLASWLAVPSKGRKALIYAALAFLLLLGILYGASKMSNWWGQRQVDKAKANLNAAVQEVKDAQAKKTEDEKALAVSVEHVKQAANDVVTASNAA